MFERVISHLQSEVRTRNNIANDTTGVVTQTSKDQYTSDAKEFQEAIEILKAKNETDA